jgi:CheY-like chemotaxis protein
MPLFWPRNRVNQTTGRHVLYQRRWLALERLEDRCLLSTQAHPLGMGGLLLSSQPAVDGYSAPALITETTTPLAVVASTGNLSSPSSSGAKSPALPGNSPGSDGFAPPPPLTSPAPSVVAGTTSLSGLTLTAGEGDSSPTQTNNLPSVPQQVGLNPPNTSTVPPGSSNNTAGPSAPTQTPGDNSSQLAGQTLATLPPSQISFQVQEPRPEAGNLSSDEGGIKLQSATLDNSAPQTNRLGAGTGVVSLSSGGLRHSAETLSDQKGTLTVQSISSNSDAIAAAAVGSLQAVANLLDPGSRLVDHSSLTSGISTVTDEASALAFGTGENPPEFIQGRLTESWVAHYLASPLAAPTGYAAGAGTRTVFNPPAVNFTTARAVSGSVELGGMDPGAEMQVDPANVAAAGHAELAGGFTLRGNELSDKPATGAATLSNPLPASTGLPENAPALAVDFGHASPTLSFASAVLWAEPAPWLDLAIQNSRLDPALRNGPSFDPRTLVAPSEIFPALPPVDLRYRFELFQTDVVSTATAPNDIALSGTSGPTSVYQTQENSSFWSLLTTYALVLMPRQRRPQPTILVVDPDDATREALNLVLVREGYFVLPAASVRDAWGMFRTPHARIDLVLLDPHLPDVSGIHLCARLRELSPTLPVMVCAQDVEPAEVAQLQQLGVRYYLRKPIAPEELVHTVKAILA